MASRAGVYGPLATQPHLFNPDRRPYLAEDRAWESAPTVRALPSIQQGVYQAPRPKTAAPVTSYEPRRAGHSRKPFPSLSALPTLLSPRWSNSHAAAKQQSRELLRVETPRLDHESQLTEEGMGELASPPCRRAIHFAACAVLCAGVILTGVTLLPQRERETCTSWLIQNLPFLHAPGVPTGCYGAFPGLVGDEGAGVNTLSTHSLETCKAACDDYAQCNSVTFCPSLQGGCWLKARVLEGNEPAHTKGDCKTFYKKPCSSAR